MNVASRATTTSLGMWHTRSCSLHFDEPLPGAEPGEVEHEITRAQWLTPSRT